MNIKSLFPLALTLALCSQSAAIQGDVTSICTETCATTTYNTVNNHLAGANVALSWTDKLNGNAQPVTCETCVSCKATMVWSISKPAGVPGYFQHTWGQTPGNQVPFDTASSLNLSGTTPRQLDCNGSYVFVVDMGAWPNYASGSAVFACGGC